MSYLYANAMLYLVNHKLQYLMSTYEPADDSFVGMAATIPKSATDSHADNAIAGLCDIEDDAFWNGNVDISYN